MGARAIMSKRAGRSFVTTRCFYVLALTSYALLPSHALAQWWTAAPADYEDCAERADRSALAGEAKVAALSKCESAFAGRRKPGGGYIYHDFMQNRSFDIAGPNPTAAEQKMIDTQYAIYLDDQRHSIILAAFARKLNEAASPVSVEESDFRDTSETTKLPSPVALPRPRPKQQPAAKGPDCATEPLACGWSRLSSGLKDIKDALFGPPKTKRT